MRGMKTDMQNQVEQVDRIGLSLQAVLVKNQGFIVVVGRDGQGRDTTAKEIIFCCFSERDKRVYEMLWLFCISSGKLLARATQQAANMR